MSRGRLALLGLLAPALVAGGTTSVSMHASPLDFHASTFDASDVDTITQRVNPSLSPEQRRRLARS